MRFTVQLFILTLSLLQISADKQCDSYLAQCNLFKERCNPTSTTVNTCCDMTGFQAPSAVYQMRKCASGCAVSTPFTSITTDVYCDMNTTGGGWIVIQRNRKDRGVEFDRSWMDYEEGFGDLDTEFWYGLSKLHCLTQSGQWEMRIDYQTRSNATASMYYSSFGVGNASSEYLLTVEGEGEDHLILHSGVKFSTKDNDNDNSLGNCAILYNSGWWYAFNCPTNYMNINTLPPYIGDNVMLTEMKIRQKNCLA